MLKMKRLSKTRAKYIPLALTSILISYFFYSFVVSESVVMLNNDYINTNGEFMKTIKEDTNLNKHHGNFFEEHKNIVENHIGFKREQFNMDQFRDIYRKRLDNLAIHRDILAQKEMMSSTLSQIKDIVQKNVTRLILVKQPHSIHPLTARPFPLYQRLPSKRSHWTSVKEFAKRKRQLDKVCSQQHVYGQVHGVYTHTSGVIYCYVPKAGCTFWKRVFTSSNFPPGQDPFNISRNTIHFTYGSGDAYSSSHHGAAYPIRLLVVRDPFSRLLSSYLDKIYLPDFWPHIAQRLILARETCSNREDFLRSHFDQMPLWFEARRRKMSTCQEGGCVKYLTFSEFVRGALVIDEPHWAPIHQICNPFTFKATHVARMESFNEDALPILHHMEMQDVLDNFNQTEQINKEIEMLIDYHFTRIHNNDVATFYQGCITPAELAFRLWQTYQWKGYIDPEMTYTLPDVTASEETIKQELIRQVWQARKAGLERPEIMKAAARRFREMAYRSVPKDLFENMMMKYFTDFELFGYKQTRNKLYSTLFNGNYDSVFRSHEQ